MSYQKFIEIMCDGLDCNNADSLAMAQTATKARKLLFKDGWRYKGGHDYCPECEDKYY